MMRGYPSDQNLPRPRHRLYRRKNKEEEGGEGGWVGGLDKERKSKEKEGGLWTKKGQFTWLPFHFGVFFGLSYVLMRQGMLHVVAFN